MSSNLPPLGPPPPPPPGGPGNEFLDSGTGGHLPPSRPARGGRRTGIVVGGALVGLAAVGTGGWFAWSAYFATGPQPAEALPDATIGYVSVDLDPSGRQKLEALEFLERFPAFAENVDVDSDDDVRQKLFDYLQDSEGACPTLDFGDDIEPWLGDRFGVAALDLGGESDDSGLPEITPVGVVQIEDADLAEAGLEKLRDCAGSTPSDAAPDTAQEVGGWSIQGDWVVIAETEELANQVTEAAAENPLSDDEDYQKWTDAAGDAGILTAYAAPEAGALFAETLGSFPMGGSFEEDLQAQAEESTAALTEALEGFEGAALTVRFDDGGLEVESATGTDLGGLATLYGTDRGDDVVATLPEDTAVAIGAGFEEGWFTELTDYFSSLGGGMVDLEEGLAMIEAQTGLSLPEDIETLTGSSAALAVGGDLDPDAFEDDPGSVPAGLKVEGDPEAIRAVVDKLLAGAQVPAELEEEFGFETTDDYAVAGFSSDYTEQLLEDGGLGDTEIYQDVVPESDDASAVVFVNFDAGDWLVEVADGDEDVERNLAPLEAAGMSAWTDDDVSHSLLRVTTD